MRILVTGGAGFIASHFARYLLQTYRDYAVIVYDQLTYAGLLSRVDDLKRTFADRFIFVQGDIRDAAAVRETLLRCEIDAIVNFAGESHVDRSVEGPQLFVQTNVLGSSVLLENAVRCGIRKMVQASTDEVYGDISFGSVGEGTLLRPRNPYAASKAAADEMVMAYHASFGLNVSIARSSNNYGPWQHPEKFIAKSILLALQGRPIPLHGDGRHMRDWIWVLDNCQAIDLVLHKGTAGETYNIGAGELYTNLALATLLLQLMGLSPDLVEYVADRQTNDRRYLMDTSKLRSLDWAPTLELADGLSQTIQWYKKMSDWWEPLLATVSTATVRG